MNSRIPDDGLEVERDVREPLASRGVDDGGPPRSVGQVVDRIATRALHDGEAVSLLDATFEAEAIEHASQAHGVAGAGR